METLVLHHNREDVPFKLQMKDACDALKGHSDIEIFAFLTLARSIEPDFQYANEEGSLPIEQVKAVSILRGWPDDLIFQSLEWARCNGTRCYHRVTSNSILNGAKEPSWTSLRTTVDNLSILLAALTASQMPMKLMDLSV